MLDGDQFHNKLILVGQIVFLRGYAIIIDRIIIDMLDFSVILDMDFLSRYRNEINYNKKKVIFSVDDGKQFIFEKG